MAKTEKTDSENSKKSSFTDTRDGQIYKTIQMIEKLWMAENLNYNTSDSYCFEENENNCQKYGRLYTWESAISACPKGWHLPSEKEWKTMLKYIFGKNDNCESCYKELTKKRFGVLLGGFRNIHGDFDNRKKIGYYWSSTTKRNSNDDASFVYFDKLEGKMFRNNADKSYGYSCRCVED